MVSGYVTHGAWYKEQGVEIMVYILGAMLLRHAPCSMPHALTLKEPYMDTDMHDRVERYIDDHTDDVSPLLQDLMVQTESLTGLARWSIGKV